LRVDRDYDGTVFISVEGRQNGWTYPMGDQLVPDKHNKATANRTTGCDQKISEDRHFPRPPSFLSLFAPSL
jgi:hypothetical protein